MIRKISIDNFQSISQFAMDAAPINIIIGENDTGKTGLLKILYASTKAYEDHVFRPGIVHKSFQEFLSEKLINTFQPTKSGLGELVNKKSGKGKLKVELTYYSEKSNKQDLYFSFGDAAKKNISDCSSHVEKYTPDFNTLFIPAKELLTAFRAIELTREEYNMAGFDDTYFDLIKALRLPNQKGRISEDLKKVNDDLEKLFDGRIEQQLDIQDQPFVFKKDKSEFSMSMTAEGVKKIGILTTLIRNRKLNKNTILFIDEPDATLHPKAIRAFSEMLANMAKNGIQLFVTTHNFFLIKQLSIIAKRDQSSMNFVSLSKYEGSIHSSIGDLKDGLPDNPIISESLEMFRQEIEITLKK